MRDLAHPLPRTIFGKALYERRRHLGAWSLVFLFFDLYIGAFYPLMRDMDELQELLQGFSTAGRLLIGPIVDLSRVEGFYQVEMFHLLLPLGISLLLVGQGLNAIVREEQRGTVDLLLATPITRTRWVVENSLALAVAACVVGMANLGGMLLADALFDLNLSFGYAFQANVAVVLFGWAMGSLALALGACLGRRGPAVGMVTAFWVVSYLLYDFSDLEAIRPFRWLSLHYWYGHRLPLLNGLAAEDVLVLLGVGVGLLLVAVVGVNRRDLGVA